MNRVGEHQATQRFFRSERFVNINHQWYYLIRGGHQEGPFDRREDAEHSLSLYVALQESGLADNWAPRKSPFSFASIKTNIASTGPRTRPRCENELSPLASTQSIKLSEKGSDKIPFHSVASGIDKVEKLREPAACNDHFHFDTALRFDTDEGRKVEELRAQSVSDLITEPDAE